jgi:hypothetical protein
MGSARYDAAAPTATQAATLQFTPATDIAKSDDQALVGRAEGERAHRSVGVVVVE